jgi:hypothetical protein
MLDEKDIGQLRETYNKSKPKDQEKIAEDLAYHTNLLKQEIKIKTEEYARMETLHSEFTGEKYAFISHLDIKHKHMLNEMASERGVSKTQIVKNAISELYHKFKQTQKRKTQSKSR